MAPDWPALAEAGQPLAGRAVNPSLGARTTASMPSNGPARGCPASSTKVSVADADTRANATTACSLPSNGPARGCPASAIKLFVAGADAKSRCSAASPFCPHAGICPERFGQGWARPFDRMDAVVRAPRDGFTACLAQPCPGRSLRERRDAALRFRDKTPRLDLHLSHNKKPRRFRCGVLETGVSAYLLRFSSLSSCGAGATSCMIHCM